MSFRNYAKIIAFSTLAACGVDSGTTIETPYGRGTITDVKRIHSPEDVDRYSVKLNGGYLIGFRRDDGTWLVRSDVDKCSDLQNSHPPCDNNTRKRIIGILEHARSIDDKIKR
jgi:hypothetical protein